MQASNEQSATTRNMQASNEQSATTRNMQRAASDEQQATTSSKQQQAASNKQQATRKNKQQATGSTQATSNQHQVRRLATSPPRHAARCIALSAPTNSQCQTNLRLATQPNRNSLRYTLNPKPETRNPKPETLKPTPNP